MMMMIMMIVQTEVDNTAWEGGGSLVFQRGQAVRALDLRSEGSEFKSHSDR